MKQVIAMHGWAGSPATWTHWQSAFETEGWLWTNGDRGYNGSPQHQPTWSDQANRRVLIAHSLGWHLVPDSTLAQTNELILLASFSRFIPEGRAGRRLKTGLDGMKRSLQDGDGIAMLERFFSKVAHPLAPSALPPNRLVLQGLTTIGRDRLQADLHHLAGTHGLPSGRPDQARILLIQGGADAVVTAETHQCLLKDLKDQGFNDLSHCGDPNWGHALITQTVLAKVMAWLQHSA